MKLQRQNIEIDYVRSGKGQPTLVFVHGSFTSKDYWKSQLEFFAPTHEVVALDLPGHGSSGKNRDEWTIEDFGKDLASALTVLNLHNVILVGHSMGADVALECAVAQPEVVTGFVAIDYFKTVGQELPQEVQQNVLAGLHKNFADTSEQYARTGLLTKETPASIVIRVLNDFRSANVRMGRSSIASLFGYCERETLLLKQLRVKLHLLNCDYQPTNESALKSVSAGYDLTSIHATSHFPMIEVPDAFNEALAGIVRKI